MPRKQQKPGRPVIDRSYYRSAAFKQRLIQAAEQDANDPAYREEIAAWHVTVGDGLIIRDANA